VWHGSRLHKVAGTYEPAQPVEAAAKLHRILKPKSPRRARAFVRSAIEIPGAGEGIRTLDPDLGKVVLYH
jgi:hypothetical protein